ncbi:MAG TPA: hypothetical protein PK142_02875 [bacterium]|nr:hypothetical protein [bacterium]
MRTLEFFFLNVFQWYPYITGKTASRFLGSGRVFGMEKSEKIPISFHGLKKIGKKNNLFHHKGEKFRWVIKKGDNRSLWSKKIDLKGNYYLELTIIYL